MRIHKSFDKVPLELREALNRMITDNNWPDDFGDHQKGSPRYIDMVQYCKTKGISISLSVVGRYAKKIQISQNDKRELGLDRVPAYKLFCLPQRSGEDYKYQGRGKVLRHLRDFAGMSQNLFGRFLQGYNYGQIARYETEQVEPPIDFWRKVIRAFGLNINWALTGLGVPYVLEFQNSKERQRFHRWENLISKKESLFKGLDEN